MIFGKETPRQEDPEEIARRTMRDELVKLGWSSTRAAERAENVNFRAVLEQAGDNLSDRQLGSLALHLGRQFAQRYKNRET